MESIQATLENLSIVLLIFSILFLLYFILINKYLFNLWNSMVIESEYSH